MNRPISPRSISPRSISPRSISKRRFLLMLLAIGFSAYNLFMNQVSAQQEIGFVEKFALADVRSETLKQLIPGTEEYYYYHALHYQNTQQLDKVDDLLKAWNKRLGSTARYKVINNRQALLKFDDNPKSTYDYLTKQLNPNFQHQRRIPRADRKLPSQLNTSMISIESLSKIALASHNTDGFEKFGLEQIKPGQLNSARRRHLLSRLEYPDFPNLVALILKDLSERNSGGFGSLNIHNLLTVEQLDECLTERPKLLQDTQFVFAYMSRLQPGADENWSVDRDVHRKYLKRLRKFAEQLPPTFNSLKACIVFRQLELDRLDGKYDRKLFMEYLKLPKRSYYVNNDFLEDVRSKHVANLSTDYSGQIRLVAVGSDEPLIREYLHHFLKSANGYSAFAPYIQDSYLKQQYATVKILNGLGDTEKWASMLGPEAYRSIVDRIDLEFAGTNTEFFADDETVKIDLLTKNINKLIVKVYEINAFNYYRKNQTEIDTDINLDGLLPNSEEAYEYSEAPAVRKQRTYTFDKLTGPGVYVVDFIAGGKSSRALIRRGRLMMVGAPTAAGHQFAIYDHDRNLVKDANLWIAGRRYEADKKSGLIMLPYSTQPKSENAIISRGNFSCLQSYQQLAENYQLQAGIYIDRENLLIGQESQVTIRPSLRINGVPSSVQFLEDVELAIVSSNHDGSQTTKRFKDIELHDDKETICKFIVPPRLNVLNLSLQAKVKNISQNTKNNLVSSQAFVVNQIDLSDEIQDLHLMPTDKGYFLEVRGKSGEVRAKQAVRLSLKHRCFKKQFSTDLQSDDSGLVYLDKLDLLGITSITAGFADGSHRTWPISDNKQTYWDAVHSLKGDTIEIPVPTGHTDFGFEDFVLLERIKNLNIRSWHKKVSIKDGLMLITGLPAGDFQLHLKQIGRKINIRVTDGVAGKQMVAIGRHRHLEVRDPKPLHIKSIDSSDDKIEIQLGNAGKLARVHLIASRYQPRFDSFGEFSNVRDTNPFTFAPSVRRSVYMAGRVIGDEYQYILDRKYANRYPGNMLDRPSILLAPWAWRDTNNNLELLRAGGEFGEAGTDDDESLRRSRQSKRGGRGQSKQDFANLDFLPADTTVLVNLKADKDGKISVDRAQLAGRQFVRVVAVDHLSTIEKHVALKPTNIKSRDLRLAHALDPDKNFSQSKATEILQKGKELMIDDLVSAKFQQFDDLGDIYRLFLMLNTGTELSSFKFILTWSDKADEEKQRLYSKYACHELNYYLFKKDKPFFDRVILPHLENKRERTFMDEYLLGDRLEKYLDSLRFESLNVFEKILLSQRMEKESADIVRNLLDRYMMNPSSPTTFDGLYDLAMASGRLNSSNGVIDGGAAYGGGVVTGGFDDSGLPGLDSGGQQYFGSEYKDAYKSRVKGKLDKDGLGRQARDAAPPVQLPAPEASKTPRKSRDASRPGGGGGIGGGGRGVEGFGFDETEAEADEAFFIENEKLGEIRKKAKSLYRRLPATREWIEHNYFHVGPGTNTANLVATNRFWRDYANHQAGPFLSSYFLECKRSLAEMMFALAVLDLPEKADEHQFDYADDGSLKITPGGAMIAFHQQVRPAEMNDGNTTILISENFFQKNDRHRHDDKGVQYDKFVSDKFLAHTLYGGQVVVTNPTSTPRLIELLVQVPKGSLCTSRSQPTRTIKMQLAAFQSSTFEYHFYFPTAGDFQHYPAHVSSDEKVLAVAAPVNFKVTDEPAELDRTSWEFVSQNGSADDVIDFISKNNALRIDMSQIAFRMQDKAFFTRTIDALRNRYVYHHELWQYALKHRDQRATGEYLAHESRIANNVGVNFQSPLLTIQPIERQWYQHREYSPLVNARFHGLGARRQILNPQFHEQYHKLLNLLAHKSELTDDDHLVVTYYMLLQDRIDNAVKHFENVSQSKIETKMQYEYCSAYMDMYLEQPDAAAAKAEKWVSYPVGLWRNRFKNILAQVEEIRGGTTDIVDDKSQSQQQTKLAADSVSFDFKVEGQKIAITGQNLAQANINFYEMDIELLFSRNPFAQDEFDGFSIIRPNLTKSIKLDTGQATQNFDLPKELMNKNVLVEIESGDQVKSKPYFANSLAVQLIQRYGQLRVTETMDNKTVPKTYVKVYARGTDGQTRFHKDGYTDLRGRFDYVTQSNNPLDNVAEYSILVLSPEYGAVVKKADPPAE